MIRPIKRKRGESGNALFLGTAALVYIIPLMGLSIDTSFLYAVKGRLQAAVDGASLGAARALNIGTTLQSQQTTAAQNAVNWFYANFPPNTWATTGTVMSDGSVTQNSSSGFYSQSVNIYPDSSNPQLDHVDIAASTNVPTWFMHWFGVNSTKLNVKSSATRRAVVAMMVLDRSGSMCMSGGTQHSPCSKSNTSYPCYSMIEAAKTFTGQFAEGRDYIGMVSFSHNAYIHTPPTQSFQTTLGYTSSFGSGAGQIDNLVCNGGTNTAQAVSIGYQLLYQTGLPGALNVLLLETDGLPNTVTMNFWDGSTSGLSSSSTCKDNNNKTKGNGGFSSAAALPSWTTGLSTTSSPFLTTTGVYSSIPAGIIMAVSSSDPSQGNYFWVGEKYSTTTTSNDFDTDSPYVSAASCGWSGGGGQPSTSPSDFQWWPKQDVWGNLANPSSAYKSVTTDAQGHVLESGGWTNYHNFTLNAADYSAYAARANTTNPAYVMAIGLGGNSTTGPPDPILMQRMANDPNGDEFNTSGPDAGGAYYLPCAQETGCTTYSSQYQGTFVYAPTSAQLAQAFLKISSQILRLNK